MQKKVKEDIRHKSIFHENYIQFNNLQDLANYDYDEMVTVSMSLLDRFYSSYDNLFRRAVQAQVSISFNFGHAYLFSPD